MAADTHAAGNLAVMPTRVMFEGRERTAEVSLTNTGDEESIYRLALVNRRMTAGGSLVDVADKPLPGERFADGLVRFSPRQVVLKPGESQVVRLQLRRPAGLEAGEYRSHLAFRAVPRESGPPAAEGREFRVTLTPIYGVSIPVIVRHGELGADVGIRGLTLLRDRRRSLRKVAFTLTREGGQSVYGDIDVKFVDEAGGERILARARGLAVYTPNDRRKVTLDVVNGGVVEGGTIVVSYRQKPEAGGRVLAEVSGIVGR